MNKYKLKLICGIIILVLFVGAVTITAIFTRKKDEFFLTTIPKSYCLVTDTALEKEVEAMLYVSNKKSFVTDIKKISSAYISSRNRLDKLKVDLKSITDCNTSSIIKSKEYFLYSYVFTLPIIDATDYDLSINDAIIILEYFNEEIEIKLGSFYFYKIPYFGDKYENMSISKLKGIVNYVNGNKTLVGIVLGINNKTNNDLTISDIELLDKSVKVSMEEVQELVGDAQSSDDISSLLGYDYDLYEIENGNNTITIEKKEVAYFIVPIKYLNNYIIDSAAIKINYMLGDDTFYYYLDNIKLFTDFNMIIDEGNLEVLSYNGN